MANVYNKPIVVIGGGGGSAEIPVDKGVIYEGKYRVRYFDVDGTVLKIEYVANGGKTTPPDAPSYDPDYLIFDEWNYDTANYIVDRPTDIGATYNTINNITYLFCRVAKTTGLTFTIRVSNFTSIDWGDGVENASNTHAYANEGNYIIKIKGSVTYSMSSIAYLLGSETLNSSLHKAYLGKNISDSKISYVFRYCKSLSIASIPKINTVMSGTFNECYSLKYFTIPNGVTELKSSAFFKNHSLTNISIPLTVTVLGDSIFNYVYSLEYITLSDNITQVGNNIFESCYSLKHIRLSENILTFPNYMLSNASTLKEITVPKNVTSLGSLVFNNCSSLTNILLECSSVPSIAKNTFNNINKGLIIWVNDSIIEQLKGETNWSNYASYMRPLSWYPSLTDPNA